MMDTEEEIQTEEEEQPWQPRTERQAQVNIAQSGERLNYGLREVEEFFPRVGFYYEKSDGFTYSVKKTDNGGWEKSGDRHRGRRVLPDPQTKAHDPQVVRPHPTRMDDLPMKPSPAVPQTRTQTHAPLQPTVVQRRANQQSQPRDRVGKYAEKPASKWKQHLPGTPASASLKRQRTPARPARPMSSRKRTQTQLPAMAAMEHAHPIAKIHWWVTRGFRRWRRRKAKALKTLFSLKG